MGMLKCFDTRACFARNNGRCSLLKHVGDFKSGECPFCKPERSVTNGKKYPYNYDYAILLGGKE